MSVNSATVPGVGHGGRGQVRQGRRGQHTDTLARRRKPRVQRPHLPLPATRRPASSAAGSNA